MKPREGKHETLRRVLIIIQAVSRVFCFWIRIGIDSALSILRQLQTHRVSQLYATLCKKVSIELPSQTMVRRRPVFWSCFRSRVVIACESVLHKPQ